MANGKKKTDDSAPQGDAPAPEVTDEGKASDVTAKPAASASVDEAAASEVPTSDAPPAPPENVTMPREDLFAMMRDAAAEAVKPLHDRIGELETELAAAKKQSGVAEAVPAYLSDPDRPPKLGGPFFRVARICLDPHLYEGAGLPMPKGARRNPRWASKLSPDKTRGPHEDKFVGMEEFDMVEEADEILAFCDETRVGGSGGPTGALRMPGPDQARGLDVRKVRRLFETEEDGVYVYQNEARMWGLIEPHKPGDVDPRFGTELYTQSLKWRPEDRAQPGSQPTAPAVIS